MTKKISIIGAGINGLVAANYLARAGFDVTVIERKDIPGGACCATAKTIGGISYEYPQGASVLGMMQEFVFEETGLSKRVKILKPTHPLVAYSVDDEKPVLQWDDAERFKKGAKEHWGERGDVAGFFRNLEKVVAFLRTGYQSAEVPTIRSAKMILGGELVDKWISGSTRGLLDTYFTSEGAKLLFAVSSVESGPVSFDAPYSAFSIPLMHSGSVFAGSWGYVKGGIWQIPLALDKINAELGVKRVFNTLITNLDDELVRDADYIVLATDPLTAARITGEKEIQEKIAGQRTTGAAGKLIMLFRKPVQWKGNTNLPGFEEALRDIVLVKTLNEFEELEQKIADGKAGFIPTYIEIYPEGAGDKAMRGNRSYEIVSIFFNALCNTKTGEEMPEVKKTITDLVLCHVLNPEDLIDTILETPKDLMNSFYFSGGNIDHIELAEGQTFFDRNYSPRPHESFYQFGSNPNVFYCAAGCYPCGSVAGTNGYMCAKQIISLDRKLK